MLVKNDRKTLGVPLDNHATSYHRVIQPLYELAQQGHPIQFLGEPANQPEQYKWAEILYIQCLYAPGAYKFYADQKTAGKKIVLDFDDDYINIPKESPEQTEVIDAVTGEVHRFPPELRSLAVQMFTGLADIVVTTTTPLAQLYNRWAKKIITIPNCMSPEMKRDRPKTPNDKVRILWSGSTSHLPDLLLIIEPLKAIYQKYQDKVEFHFQGSLEFDRIFTEIPIVQHPAVPFADYLDSVQDINPDIALAPLQPNVFNLGKSNLKYMQMSFMESAFVGSKYGPYHDIDHGVDGMVAVSPQDWVESISALIESSELRTKLVSNAIKHIEASYMIEQHLHTWKNLLRY